MAAASENRVYRRRECAVFSKTREAFGGLSNMAGGYPLSLNGVSILTSEALYQACRFPHLPEIQRLIIAEASPMTAKMRSKPHRSDSRPDWDAVRVRIMRWCLRVKLAQNWGRFRQLLLSTEDRPIVEESRRDAFWGAKVIDEETLSGSNVLGRLLMELREAVNGPDAETLHIAQPLDIPQFLLYGQPIPQIEAADHEQSTASQLEQYARSLIDIAPSGETAALISTTSSQPEVKLRIEDRGIKQAMNYPKRLIEVDLPIKRISAHSRREKSIRHGHISTLHIWWARRPLAACRAVICAALWPDPADELCPDSFRGTARELMLEWTTEHLGLLGEESSARFIELRNNPSKIDDNRVLRQALLDFIADFSNWDNSTVREYLDTSRALTQAAHEALGGAPGTRPLVVDPFAGGGSIPLEALRVGTDAFASDLNPVAVLLNKVVLEYIPKYGLRLADEVRKWGDWIKREAEKELVQFYPKDANGATPIAYLWARTIQCEGPGCGAEVPLIRSLWLAKKANRSVALQLVPNHKDKRVDFQIIVKQRDGWVDQANARVKIAHPRFDGTVKRGSATCPLCGYTTPVGSVRTQLRARGGGCRDARLFCIVAMQPGQVGRRYRTATEEDSIAVAAAVGELDRQAASHRADLSFLPDERFTGIEPRRIPLPQYGIDGFGQLFLPRQSLTVTTLVRKTREAIEHLLRSADRELATAVGTLLAFAVDRIVDQSTTLVLWASTIEVVKSSFGRQALPMTWDFVEAQPFAGSAADFGGAIEWIARVCVHVSASHVLPGSVESMSATEHSLPDDIADAVITDPPYYYSVPYSDLSDFFYVWLRRTIGDLQRELFRESLSPKQLEIVQNLPHSAVAHLQKTRDFYEEHMRMAMAEARRIAKPTGISVVVFAHTETDAWEAMLTALIDSGWMITGSWPIDTERAARTVAHRQSTLASSVHLVCRPRENPDGSLRTDRIGDWRDLLQELPRRIHEWMPRLAKEGVVGADAIFACLGPALEIFSRYSRVEKASGEQVTLREYLEYVWAAVAKEALNMIFEGADATGFEENARLTAMWLWTLNAGASDNGQAESSEELEGIEDDDQAAAQRKASGYSLEFDAARKIAQGLGAHLEDLHTVVEVTGDKARLLSVAERGRFLFGKQEEEAPKQRKNKKPQLALFDVSKSDDEEDGGLRGDFTLKTGETVLDRVHQGMILFGAGRSEALKRFLIEDGAGRDQRFWRLAQALAALYPSGTDERRWIEGLLARKKGLGF
jgi:putative DNA methylase